MYKKCNELKEWSSYAVAVMLLVDCRAMIGYMDITPKWWFVFKNSVMILLLIVAICVRNNGKVVMSKKQLMSIFLLGGYLLCYLMMSGYSLFSNFQRIAIVLLLLIYSALEEKRDGIQELLCKYKNIVFVVAIGSFILWLMGVVLKLGIPYSVIYTSWSGTDKLRMIESYYGICNLIGTVDILGMTIPKNAAIFTEAPMASFNFCIALMTELFLEKKSSKVKISVFVMAIVSTFSSTGLTFLIMLLVLKYSAQKQRDNIRVIIKCFILPIMSVVGILLAMEMFNAKMTVNSGVIRLDDFVVCFQAWKTKKLLGAGVGNDQYLIHFMGNWRAFNQGLSNSPGQILAHGGIWITAVYVWAIFYSLYKMLKEKNNKNLIYFILFLYLFAITVCSYQYVTYTILIWAVQLHMINHKEYLSDKDKTWKLHQVQNNLR